MQGCDVRDSAGGARREVFTAFRGRVVTGTDAEASSSTRGAEGPRPAADPSSSPAWMTSQVLDLETCKLVRAAPPACNATPVEKANVYFRQNTFRTRVAHNPERFLNYICGRPVVVLGTKMFYLWVRSAPTTYVSYLSSITVLLHPSSLLHMFDGFNECETRT